MDISYQTFVSHLAPSPPSLQPHTRLREEPTTFPLAWGKPCVTTPSPSWAQLTCRGMTEVPHYGKAGASSPRPSFLEVLMVQPLWPQEGNGQQCRHEHSRALGWHTQGAHKARPPSQDPGGAVRSSAPLFLTYHCPLAVWAQPWTLASHCTLNSGLLHVPLSLFPRYQMSPSLISFTSLLALPR